MPTIHAMHGYLGAGKTTLARRLERALPAMRFSIDEWMTALHGTDPPEAEFAAMLARVRGLMDATWTRAVQLGLDVVLDGGLWTRAERDALRAQAAGLGAELRVYDLRLPDDLAWARIQARNADLNGSLHIARHTFEVLRARFEPLGPDEDRVTGATT